MRRSRVVIWWIGGKDHEECSALLNNNRKNPIPKKDVCGDDKMIVPLIAQYIAFADFCGNNLYEISNVS
ncbi:MAG: hypothetical protein JSV84_07500 [Gemmatimonadota bacterium]|nr:MAG: hypothetical protein JSV84_07500 [Gemmatimonadota bacterium]